MTHHHHMHKKHRHKELFLLPVKKGVKNGNGHFMSHTVLMDSKKSSNFDFIEFF